MKPFGRLEVLLIGLFCFFAGAVVMIAISVTVMNLP